MSVYQTLYENICKELEMLEEQINQLYIKKENIKNECGKIEEILWEQEELLTKLETKRDDMPYKNFFKISVLCGIFSIVGCIGGISISFVIITNIVKKLIVAMNIVSNSVIILLTMGLILGILGSGFAVYKIVRKLEKRMLNNSFDKIVNSSEYQELLEKIDKLEKEIVSVKDDLLEKEQTMKDAEDIYMAYKKDRDEKKLLIEYVSKQMNPVETTLTLNKGLKSRKDNNNKIN